MNRNVEANSSVYIFTKKNEIADTNTYMDGWECSYGCDLNSAS